jgi:uncharacterized phage-like protein YoqJ
MILAGTGHRPDKLGGYFDHIHIRLLALARAELTRLRPSLVISGMALGWDQALAQAAVDLGIPFDAYLPFIDQDLTWPLAARARYWDLLKRAHDGIYCSPGLYAPWKMQKRNERMVDASDLLLALWDGTPSGTANCVRYAKRVGRPIENVWTNAELTGAPSAKGGTHDDR